MQDGEQFRTHKEIMGQNAVQAYNIDITGGGARKVLKIFIFSKKL